MNGKLRTLPYDSDHNAITFSISLDRNNQELLITNQPRFSFNYKRTKWKAFSIHLDKLHNENSRPQADRNLTIEEIDKHIGRLESTIIKAIKDKVPKFQPGKGVHQYVNTKIKKLKSYKSYLITKLYKTRQLQNNNHNKAVIKAIKLLIKHFNADLHKEFSKAVTAYWAALEKSINHKKSDSFFPQIDRIYQRKPPIQINDIHISTKQTMTYKK